MRPALSRRAALVLAAATTAAAVTPLSAQGSAERLVVTHSVLVEIVVALGLGASVVATGGNVAHLPEVAKAARLPGFRQSSAEPLLAVAPTRVLMLADERVVPQTVEQLRAAGVKVDVLDAEQTQAGAERRIRSVASLLGRSADGERLVTRLRSELDELARDLAGVTRKPRVLFMLAGGGRPFVVGGRGTGVNILLELARALNAADGFDGFKPMSQEAVIEAAPDFLLTNRDGMAAVSDGKPAVLQAPGVAATAAARAGRLVTVADHYLSGFGLFTPQGARELARRLHPGAVK